MNIIQKIGLAILALIGIVALIIINVKKKATALASEAIVNSKRRKLATNEKRYYGTPYSTFDLIKTTDTLKEINRKRYKFKDGTLEMIVTTDPDETNGWGDLVAKYEVYFTKDFDGSHDVTPNGGTIKSMASVKKGVIYDAKVLSKGNDDIAGLSIREKNGTEVFYIAYEGEYLNAGSLIK